MKKLCRKGTVHPSPAVKPDDQFLSLLPVAILSLVAALSADDREVLAYLISNSGDSNRISRLKKNKTIKEENHHSPIFLCDCFSCYTSYWSRWDSSPSRQLIHEIIDAYEHSLEMKKKKKDRRKRSGKASVRVDSVETSRLSELGSSLTEFGGEGGGDSVEERDCGGEEAEKERGSVQKLLSFIGQKFWG